MSTSRNTKLNFGRDINGYNAFAPDFAAINYRSTLSANVAQSFTVPDEIDPNYKRWLAVISIDPGFRIFIANNDTATVPGASFAASTAGSLNPTPRIVEPGDVLSFITPDATVYVTVELYAIA